MIYHNKKRFLLFLLCVFLVLIYMVIFLLPHDHACHDADCAICALMDRADTMLAAFLTCFGFVYCKSQSKPSTHAVAPHAHLGNDLVCQRVKLSD